MHLEQIPGFASLREYQRFVVSIEEHIKAGSIQEIAAEKDYHRGEIYGGRWFEHLRSGEVWRLVEPDFPFKGLWERVTFRK
jgi:hypothetical protein